jgi:hypothetical protein
VDCLNGPDPSNPPDWRIKPFTQIVQVFLIDSYQVYKIPRAQNMMADSLARRALHSLLSFQPSSPLICTNPAHCQGCPLTNALQIVSINSAITSSSFLLLILIYASCQKKKPRGNIFYGLLACLNKCPSITKMCKS